MDTDTRCPCGADLTKCASFNSRVGPVCEKCFDELEKEKEDADDHLLILPSEELHGEISE